MNLTIKNIYKCKDGRWRAYCVDEKGKPHIVSYPRILVEKKLGRPLKPNEDVHHIDKNIDNNDLSNLEVVLHGEHQKRHSTKYIDTTEVCMICGNKFIKTGKSWSRFYRDLHRKSNPTRLILCSKSCSGKASSKKYPFLYDVNDRLAEVEKLWKN